MFEFLTRHRSTRENPVENSEQLLDQKETVPENNLEQMVESFLKKSSFNGKSLLNYSQKLLSLLAREKEISQGVFFITEMKEGKPLLKFLSGFAYQNQEDNDDEYEWGEGFPGQVAKDGKLMNITDIPEGYMSIESGLGKASPASLIIFPVMQDSTALAVIELASFHKFNSDDEKFFEMISPAIAEQLLKCRART
jgi:putative methionine-R-sulfoxide reductase with GAF domain